MKTQFFAVARFEITDNDQEKYALSYDLWLSDHYLIKHLLFSLSLSFSLALLRAAVMRKQAFVKCCLVAAWVRKDSDVCCAGKSQEQKRFFSFNLEIGRT